MQSTMMDFPLTLPVLLERTRLFADTEIVSRLPDGSLHRYRYADLYHRSRAFGQALLEAGMARGDRVGTLMWNHHAHLEAYIGAPVAGGVIHTLNLRLHADEIAYIIRHAGDRFLVVDHSLLPLLEQSATRPAVEKVIVVRRADDPLAAGHIDYESFIGAVRRPLEYPALDERAPLGMCYTSGTTGAPKGVVYSHRSTLLHTLAIAIPDALGIGRNDVLLSAVPMFHANAWGLPFAGMMLGFKQVLPGRQLDPASLIDLSAQERVTFFAGVPTIAIGILDALDRAPGPSRLVPGMRMMVGGSAVPEAVLRGLDRHSVEVIHGWGMTEMSPVGTICHLAPSMAACSEDQRYAIRAKQGVPMPLVEIRARGDDGLVPWDGTTPGELEVRGPWVTARYHDLEQESDRFTADGWFRTGDVATIDAGGYVKITDRTKDLIKSGGEWISSVDLENVLMGHPSVREAAVIGIPHPKWAERPLATIVLKDGEAGDVEALRAHLASRFPKWWIPDAFVFVDAIPRTSTGKFKKSELRERYRDFQLEGPG